MWEKLSSSAQREILDVAETRLPGLADLTRLNDLFAAYEFVFKKARYYYELYVESTRSKSRMKLKKTKIPTPDLYALLGDLQKMIGQKQMAQFEKEFAKFIGKPAAAKPKDSPAIFQLKITLKGSRPPIWRRLLVPGKTKLNRLHDIFQEAMGWSDCHLHQFRVGDYFYSIPDPEFDTFDERKYRLQDLAALPKKRFSYQYDFGDDWDHVVLVEKIVEKDLRYPGHPVCLAGKGNCPPEDCGGIWGFYELLETIQDPKHPRHEEMTEWLGNHYDPEAFDLDGTNSLLSRLRIS